jgi:PIN domain nuclease of toxin-antitoxin system
VSHRYLLDTCAILWWFYEADRLSDTVVALLSDADIEAFVSPVSAMEIATKYRIGKLDRAANIVGNFAQTMADEGFKLLALTAEHADLGGSLKGTHQDPWDRLLAAQAKLEGMKLITNDQKISGFDVDLFW